MSLYLLFSLLVLLVYLGRKSLLAYLGRENLPAYLGQEKKEDILNLLLKKKTKNL
jgi:hypothetical protein